MQFYYAFISRTKCDCSCLKIALDRTIYRHHCLLGASVVWFVPKTDMQTARGLSQWEDETSCVHTCEVCAAD